MIRKPSQILKYGFLILLVVTVTSCKTVKTKTFETDGRQYHYQELTNKFAVDFTQGVSVEGMQGYFDSLGLTVYFESDVSRYVCVRKDGGEFDRETCREIASLRALDEIESCYALMKIVKTFNETKEGELELLEGREFYWAVPEYVSVITRENYGQNQASIDSIISVYELTEASDLYNSFESCEYEKEYPLNCVFRFPTGYTYKTIDALIECNEKNDQLIELELITF